MLTSVCGNTVHPNSQARSQGTISASSLPYPAHPVGPKIPSIPLYSLPLPSWYLYLHPHQLLSGLPDASLNPFHLLSASHQRESSKFQRHNSENVILFLMPSLPWLPSFPHVRIMLGQPPGGLLPENTPLPGRHIPFAELVNSTHLHTLFHAKPRLSRKPFPKHPLPPTEARSSATSTTLNCNSLADLLTFY